MKRFLFLVFFFSFLCEKVEAQYVIPDSAFAAYLTYLYPDCMSGKTLDTNCSALADTSQIYVSGYQFIHSLDGLQYLKKLKRLDACCMDLIQLPELPPSLEDLEVYANKLTSLPDLPRTLKILNCGDNLLSALPELPDSLEYIQCYQNLLTSLPALPNTIWHLRFEQNQISSLGRLPDSLKTLWCLENNLSSLPTLPSKLTELATGENHLTALPTLPPLLTKLYFDNNNITVLPALPDSLVTINGARNNLTSLPTLPANLENLYLVHNNLASIPALPNKLYRLILDSNAITSLPPLPESLGYLYVNNNELTSLPDLPSPLWSLYCSHNQLSTLPTLTYILELDCSYNRLTELPAIPDGINILYCQHNQISDLPQLPDEMQGLDCSNNKLTHVTNVPSLGYSGFICDSNLLTSLPTIPMYTVILSCNHNLLTTLPDLPDMMHSISCNDNQLTSLKLPPMGVTYLSCAYNKLTALPALPQITLLECSHNLLSSLPDLPDSLRELNCTFNPLNCLPEFSPVLGIPAYYYFPDFIYKSVGGLYVKNTNISCFSQAPDITAIVDTLLPVCINPSDVCNAHPYINGRIYWDKNSDHNYDSIEEPLLPNQLVKVSPGNWTGISNINGAFQVKLDTNIENTIMCNPNLPYSTSFPSSYSITPTALGLVDGAYDFAIQIPPGIYDLEAALGGSVVRPGFFTNATLTMSNTGTEDQSGIVVKLKIPSDFIFYSSSIMPSSIIDDTLFWENMSLDHFNSTSIQLLFQVATSIPIGSIAEYETWMNGTNGDTTPLNNYARWVEEVRGSYDPNDKLVNKDILSPTYDPDKDRLIYTIRFQNTGTDTAFTVIVRDVIPPNLDISSLKVVNASHPYQLIVREKNLVEVAFSNIQLPDSNINESGSHGFVQLSFKPVNGLHLNDEINNSASILFDYNAPVLTNTAQTKVQITTGIATNQKLLFRLYPNPSTEIITIELPYTGTGIWKLISLDGKLIRQNVIPNDSKTFQLNVNDIPSGTYILSLEINGIFSSSKVVISR